MNMQENSNLSIQLNNAAASYGFLNVIMSPTRTTDSPESIINLFITNDRTQVHSAGTICTDFSDHTPVFISIRDFNIKTEVKRTIFFYQCISDQNLLSFRNEVAGINWTPVTLQIQTNVDDSYETFLNIIKKYCQE